ncbi:MAG: DNA-binding response OmpR family regulator [Alteromonadaceae bacterium]|jgi:DNA-binding response OmpR family regulator
MLILLAEDEPDLAELTIDYLLTEGIDCDLNRL